MTKADPIETSLTAIRAQRHNLERERDDAITAAAAPFRERIDELTRAEAAIEPLVARNGDGPAAATASPPRKRRGGGRRRSKDSTPRTPTPAKPKGQSAAQRSGVSARAKANRDAALDFIRAHPGCRQAEVAEGAGIPSGSIAGVISGLSRLQTGGRPPIRIEAVGRREKRLYPYNAEAAPADVDGAKTGDERKVLECLRAADGPLPPNEIAMRTRIRTDHVPQMLQRLAQRGVVDRLPPKRDGLPPRYRPGSSGEGERPLDDAIADAIA